MKTIQKLLVVTVVSLLATAGYSQSLQNNTPCEIYVRGGKIPACSNPIYPFGPFCIPPGGSLNLSGVDWLGVYYGSCTNQCAGYLVARPGSCTGLPSNYFGTTQGCCMQTMTLNWQIGGVLLVTP